MRQSLRRRLVALGPLLFIVLTALAGALGGTTQAANAQVPSYPTTGPDTPSSTTTVPTTTVTLPQMGPYPVVVPTTAPPPTTTSPPTAAPTTTARPAPRPTAPPTTLIPLVGATERFETGREHQAVNIDAGFGNTATYSIESGPTDAVLTTDGHLRWTPGEADGGTTVDFAVRARTTDWQVRDVLVHVLVAETNSAPEVHGPNSVSGAAGDTITIKYVANDNRDDPRNNITWSVDGASGATITNGLLKWTIDPSAPAGDIKLSITATDDGEPAMSATSPLTVTVEGIKPALITAVGDDGSPLSPMVIAAFGDSEPLPVNLDKPGPLMVALGTRTPTIGQFAPPPPVESGPRRARHGVAKVLDKAAVIASVQHAYKVLLDLEVPKAAVAGGLVWQVMLLFLPGLFLRSNELFDITGLDPGQEIGDERFRFRGNATGLRAGPRRRRHGSWMRSVESPAGLIWIPASNLTSSFRGR